MSFGHFANSQICPIAALFKHFGRSENVSGIVYQKQAWSNVFIQHEEGLGHGNDACFSQIKKKMTSFGTFYRFRFLTLIWSLMVRFLSDVA